MSLLYGYVNALALEPAAAGSLGWAGPVPAARGEREKR